MGVVEDKFRAMMGLEEMEEEEDDIALEDGARIVFFPLAFWDFLKKDTVGDVTTEAPFRPSSSSFLKSPVRSISMARLALLEQDRRQMDKSCSS